ncbi:hypothetical protein ACFO0N_06480 [Halobium salinum]|uniref:Uncharacterized protein n=1 Tax=Halobium salinum TaxID=1364940 RepID=A0ABD5PA76_9EURY|nr:hypothetical protein [Halobium salinum]
MRRRPLLTAVAVGTGSVAGCFGKSSPLPPADGNDAGTAVPTPDPNGPPPESLACPPFAVDAGRVACSFGRTDTSVYPTVNRRTVRVYGDELAESLVVAIHNGSDGTLRNFNPHNPDLYAFVGGDSGEADGASEGPWWRLPRRDSGNGFVELGPGETVALNLGGPVQLDDRWGGGDRPWPGTYALVLDVPDPDSEDGWLACLAAFRLVAA